MKSRRKRRGNSFSEEFFSVKRKSINPTSSLHGDFVSTRNDLFDKYGGKRSGKKKENDEDTLIIDTNEIQIEDEFNFPTKKIEKISLRKRKGGYSSEEDEGEEESDEEEIDDGEVHDESDEEEILDDGEMDEEEEILDDGEVDDEEEILDDGEVDDEEEEEEEEGEDEIEHGFVYSELAEEESPIIRNNEPRYDHTGFRRSKLLTKIMSDENSDDLGKKDYHQISFDLSKLDENKLKSNLTVLRSPDKSNITTDASRMDLLASLHYEEEKLRRLYEESLRKKVIEEEKIIFKSKTDPFWWEKVDETFNRDLRRNTKEIRMSVRSPEGRWKKRIEKERLRKSKELTDGRKVWKYTYSKPRFIDNDLFSKHFIK